MVKSGLAAVVVLAGGLAGLAPLAGGGGAGAGCDGPAPLAPILATIRAVESAGRYDAPPNAGGASGAYQYTATTWRAWAARAGVDTARYPRADLAPPVVQDAVAARHVSAVLEGAGSVAAVPLAWYWPAAAADPAQLDVVPRADVGNRPTPRQYQARWLEVWRHTTTTSPACVGETGPVDGYALPVDRRLVEADPAMLARPHHDYPAVDLPVPVGTQIHAVRGGRVVAVTTWPGTCGFTAGCPEPCEVGLVIQDDEDARWTYCHGSRLEVGTGAAVVAGQLVMRSGNSGRSSGPHLHLGLTVGPSRRCPQPLLAALYDRRAAPRPAALPSAGCVA